MVEIVIVYYSIWQTVNYIYICIYNKIVKLSHAYWITNDV